MSGVGLGAIGPKRTRAATVGKGCGVVDDTVDVTHDQGRIAGRLPRGTPSGSGRRWAQAETRTAPQSGAMWRDFVADGTAFPRCEVCDVGLVMEYDFPHTTCDKHRTPMEDRPAVRGARQQHLPTAAPPRWPACQDTCSGSA